MASRFILLACIAVAVIAMPFRRESEEIMIPMRDGVKLHTIIHYPRNSKKNKFPVVMDRSPYGYDDMEWATDVFIPFGFVAIGQDIRGTEKSEGKYTIWQQDANDSRDLGDWIVSQDWSDGRIFTLGASADGLASLQTPMTNPSWLAGQYVIWAPAQMYNVLCPGGCYKQKTTEDWLHGLTMPDPAYVETNIQTVHENEAHTAWYREIELSPEKYALVNYPSAFYAGWYDLFLQGTIEAFDGYNTMSAEKVRYTSTMLIDPCGHCIEAAEFFAQNTVEGRTGLVIAQMFEVFGIRPTRRNNIKNITMYVMSSNDEPGLAAGQYWTTVDSWPIPNMVNLYLHADGSASMKPPVDEDSSKSSYIYDPANPVPTMGGSNLPDSIGGSIPCGPLDQSAIDKRSDVLTFNTEVLKEELAFSGALLATIYVSSDAIDTDFMVKISDVYPTGEARILQDNAVRMRWRENTLSPVYMTKNQVYKYEMSLWNTSYVLAPGHSLRVSIQSSNWPRFSVNPNNGILLADPLYPGANITATNSLYHSARYPSHIVLPVVHKRDLPQVHLLKETKSMYAEIEDWTDEQFLKVAGKFLAGMIKRMRGM